MKIKGVLSNIPAWQKFIVAATLVVFAFCVSFLFTYIFKQFLEQGSAWFNRLEQLVSALLLFIGAPVCYNFICSHKSLAERTGMANKPSGKAVLYTVLSMFFISSIIGFLAKLNQSIVFPDYLAESIKSMEDDAARLTMQIIATDNPLTILFNILIIAVIPAIGEELMFRVFIQEKMQEKMAVWLAIILTSVIFSAAHFQFYGFIPRFALSVWLGVLYFWGRGTWLNSVAHFTNNLVGVIAYYIYYIAMGQWPSVSEMESMDAGESSMVAEIILALLFVLCAYKVYVHTRVENAELKDKSLNIEE